MERQLTFRRRFSFVVEMTDSDQQEPTLKEKREAFVLAYIGEARFNGTRAAEIAGYAFPEQEAYRLLRNVQVRARIDRYLDAEALKANEVLAELSTIARAPFRDFVEVLLRDGETGEPIKVRFDLRSKVDALELLGKHHQLFSENLNINGGIELRTIVGIPEDTP